MIPIPKYINDDGISPMNLRTFSERRSILSCVNEVDSILITKFKLVFYEIIICSFHLNERNVISKFYDLTTIKNNNLVCIFNSR